MESGSVPGARPPASEEPAESGRARLETGRPGAARARRFALTTFVLSMFNAGLVSKAGEPVVLGAGARLRRDRPVARRDVGVPHRQHLRRGRLHLLRGLLDLVLGAGDLLRRRTSRPNTPARRSAST